MRFTVEIGLAKELFRHFKPASLNMSTEARLRDAERFSYIALVGDKIIVLLSSRTTKHQSFACPLMRFSFSLLGTQYTGTTAGHQMTADATPYLA